MAKRKPAAVAQSKVPSSPSATEGMSLAQKISWFSILTMIFVVPLAISNFTWLGASLPLTYDQFDIIKVFLQRVLTLVALAAWAWDLLTRGGKVRRTPVDWLVLGLLGWIAISSFVSISPATAIFGKYRRFEGLLSFINYATMYFLVLQFADRPSRVRRIAQSLFWSGVFVAGYGLLQAFGLDFLKWGQLPFEVNRSFSTYGNPDLLAGFLMFSTFVSIGLALAEKNLVWRAIYWLGFLFNAAVIVTAFTRSAWIGSIVGFACLITFAVRQRAPWKTEDWVFAGVTAAAAGGFILRSLGNANEVMNFSKRWASIFKFGEGSAKTRFEIWDAAWRATMDRPIFGFGPDTFRLVFPKYKPIEYVKDGGYLSVADNVHNYPLQLAAGIGIPGVLMFYGLLGWVAVRSFPLAWSREGGPNRLLHAAFWAACAAYVTHLLFGLSVTGSTFLLWISMAVLLAPTARSVEVKAPSWGLYVAAAVVVLAAFGIGYQVVYMQADNAYLQARIASQGAARTALTKRAVQLNPFNDMYRAEVGLALTDEVLANLQAANTASASGGDTSQYLAAARQAFVEAEKSFIDTIDFVPWEYDNYVFLANLYNMGAQALDPSYVDKAIAIGKRGIEVEPYGPAIRVQLARAYELNRQPEEAIKQLSIAVKMDPAYTEAVLDLTRLYRESGQLDKAIATLKLAESWRPGQPGVTDQLNSLQSSATTAP